MKKNISIIGCGAIGSELALSVDRTMNESISISSLLDIKLENAEGLKSKLSNNNPLVFNNFSDYIKSEDFKDVNLVIEAASQNADPRSLFAARLRSTLPFGVDFL